MVLEITLFRWKVGQREIQDDKDEALESYCHPVDIPPGHEIGDYSSENSRK